MPRADLHHAVVLDQDIFRASESDPALFDPVARVAGGLPGQAQPLAVVRDYQGPQGTYIEQFRLHDSRGRVLYESVPRRITLRGEMFEDRVVDVVRGVWFESGEEHAATFLVGGHEAGTVPVFVEAGGGGDPAVAARETFSKALQKGNVLWLAVPGPAPRRGRAPQPHTQPVWYVFSDGKVYVFSGPSEQDVPGLAAASEVEIIARSKDIRSRVAHVPATVRVIPPDDPQFDAVARAGLGRRLNLPDGDGAVERWRQNCVLVELTPRFGAEAGAA